SFAAIIGGSFLAIGLAFSGTLGNLASGVMLLIFRPFKVDDVIKVGGEVGKVTGITLFSTEMDTVDNRRIIIPNGSVFGGKIENMTHHPIRRVDVSVGVEYPADVDQTRQVLIDGAAKVADVLADPEPAVVLIGLGDSSVDWQVRVWTNTENYWAVRDATTRAAKMSLDAAGIGIPFPQIDVHMQSSAQSE
ncbi:MAG TPA: mechanosensitive ion channel, partial [Phycisphaerae bacterium]|nr:mechanosensitive ion channel [Phycisphaerae bacterium]